MNAINNNENVVTQNQFPQSHQTVDLNENTANLNKNKVDVTANVGVVEDKLKEYFKTKATETNLEKTIQSLSKDLPNSNNPSRYVKEYTLESNFTMGTLSAKENSCMDKVEAETSWFKAVTRVISVQNRATPPSS